jgi:hypothetical protein
MTRRSIFLPVLSFVVAATVLRASDSSAWLERGDWKTNYASWSQDLLLSAKHDASGDTLTVYGSCVTTNRYGLCVARYVATTGVRLWSVVVEPSGDTGTAREMTIDASGDVVVAVAQTADAASLFEVIKLNGSSGAEAWRFAISNPPGTQNGPDRFVAGLTTDANGDVYVENGDEYGFAIHKLDGTTGGVVWQKSSPTWDLRQANPGTLLSVDSSGNVLVEASRITCFPYLEVYCDWKITHLVLMKLDGSSGEQIWYREIDTDDRTTAYYRGRTFAPAARDADGDIFVSFQQGQQVNLARVSAASGDTVWQEPLALPGVTLRSTFDVALGTDGTVALGGIGEIDGTGVAWMAKYLQTGTAVWTRQIADTNTNYYTSDPSHPRDMMLDASGNVYVTGRFSAVDADFAVFRLAAATGDIEWSRFLDGTNLETEIDGCDQGNMISLASDGRVLIAGEVNYRTNDQCQLLVAKLEPATGSFGEMRIGADKISLADEPGSFTFSSSGPELILSPPGEQGDPTCSGPDGGGGSLRVFSTGGSSSDVVVDLPCEYWTADRGAFLYSDRDQQAGPCSKIQLSATRAKGRLKIACNSSNGDAPFVYPLDETPQGSVGVLLTAGGVTYCTEFAAASSEIAKDNAESFRAKKGPRPAACPVP